jgi:hypothetical protein
MSGFPVYEEAHYGLPDILDKAGLEGGADRGGGDAFCDRTDVVQPSRAAEGMEISIHHQSCAGLVKEIAQDYQGITNPSNHLREATPSF